jgi:putative ABC transport system permease protein
MAWRDSRRSRSRLLLFTSSITLGIAALVAINSFNENLRRDVDRKEKELLGADLVITANQPVNDTLRAWFDSLGGQQAQEASFASMVQFAKGGGTRLVQVRALGGAFPFYGEIETQPQGAGRQFQQDRRALVDQTLLLQFAAQPGDSVRVGRLTFGIEGQVNKVPGQSGIAATVAPPVYIPLALLPETGLVQRGSRINYRFYFKFPNGTNIDQLIRQIEPRLDRNGLNHETVASRKQNIGRVSDNLNQFLNLVAFIALLLGCVGVASAVHVYVKEKIPLVAVMRCLGATGQQAFQIYLFQIVAMGLLGSVLGAVLGAFVQTLLPVIFKEFLPVEVTADLSWGAIGQGVLMGLAVAVLFALLPLLGVRNVSPLRTLRSSFEEDVTGRDPLRWAVYGLILLFVFGFSWLQIRQWAQAVYFTLGLVGSVAVLAGLGQLVMWAVRKFFPTSWSYLWRQSLANLYRPNNQTLVLILSIGLGTALISTLLFVQNLLLGQVQFAGRDNQPNMVLFDIQSVQKDKVHQLVSQNQMPLLQQVPVVTMRLAGINGRTAAQIKADTTDQTPNWAVDREYRVTYRDSLIDSEKTLGGRWRGQVTSPSDTIYVSLEAPYAKRIGVKLGDRLKFDVQGLPMETVVGHLREVDFSRVQTNFLVLFPTGVLEQAPQFHVLVTRVGSKEASARFQQALVREFPNVSVVDLDLILQTLDEVLDEISFAIRFMALFSILTGILVLIGSVIISKYQRMRESVLLRTLGANRRQVLIINVLEYFILGSLASLSGVVLALLASWALAYFSFETVFVPQLWPIFGLFVGITGLTMFIGLANARGILDRPPLEILRSEV